MYRAASVVGERLDLPEGWLNDAVKGFLLGPDPFPTRILDLPGLRWPRLLTAEVQFFVEAVMDEPSG